MSVAMWEELFAASAISYTGFQQYLMLTQASEWVNDCKCNAFYNSYTLFGKQLQMT